MTALKKQLIEMINELPDNKLIAIKPILDVLSDNTMYVERVNFDDLEDDEKEAVLQGRKEYEKGELTDFEDFLKEQGITIN